MVFLECWEGGPLPTYHNQLPRWLTLVSFAHEPVENGRIWHSGRTGLGTDTSLAGFKTGICWCQLDISSCKNRFGPSRMMYVDVHPRSLTASLPLKSHLLPQKERAVLPTIHFQGRTLLPIGSMYGIFTYICLKCMVNAGKYTIHGSYGLNFGGCILLLDWEHFGATKITGP